MNEATLISYDYSDISGVLIVDAFYGASIQVAENNVYVPKTMVSKDLFTSLRRGPF